MSDLTDVFLSEPLSVWIENERFHLVQPPALTRVPVWEREDWQAFSQRHRHVFEQGYLSFFAQTRAEPADWPMARYMLWRLLDDHMKSVQQQCEQLFGDRI